MKCPRCGTTNGKTNRFCRGCGLGIEDLALREPERQAEAASPPDEVALGEELFEVWQIYSRGDLDAALDKAERILRNTPDSASAHSIMALIYERKAEDRAADGDEDLARELRKLAITQYERIIDLNPDSAADREKLAALRLRLNGQQVAPAPVQPVGFRAAIKAIPTPLWAAFGAFLIVLMALIILIPGDESKVEAKRSRSAGPTRLSQVSTPNAASEASAAPGNLRIYTFPGPSASLSYPSTPTTPPPPVPEPDRLRIPTEPAKLPSIIGANVKIVPEAKGAARSPKPGKDETSKPKPAVLEEKPSTRPEGDTSLARAVELRRQGASQEAVIAAQEAMRLYQADIDAQRNVTAARRGLDNARKIIELSQEKAGESSASQ